MEHHSTSSPSSAASATSLDWLAIAARAVALTVLAHEAFTRAWLRGAALCKKKMSKQGLIKIWFRYIPM